MAQVPYRASQSFAGAASNDDEAFAYAEQVVFNMYLSMVMKTAIDLDLFDILARAGSEISAAEVADQLPASNKEEAADRVDRMLRLLASFSLVTCSVNGAGRRVYGVAAAGRYFARDEDGVSLAPGLCLSLDVVELASWGNLRDAILEGKVAFNKAHGMYAYEYHGTDPRYNNVYNLAMLNYGTVILKRVLQQYKGFENLTQVIDVGGGIGHTLKTLVSEYPTIKGINFDLPHVIENAPFIPGVEHVGGDMFESVARSAEAILVKWLLPALSDDKCVKLLKNCYSELPSKGRVIIMEYVMEEEVETGTAARVKYLRDVLVMSRHHGARDRTRKEHIALAKAAEFATVEFQPCGCNVLLRCGDVQVKEVELHVSEPSRELTNKLLLSELGVTFTLNRVTFKICILLI